jgi:hypothetical protein
MSDQSPVRFVAGGVNKVRLQNILLHAIDDCTRVRAAVAYATYQNRELFDACKAAHKPLVYYGRYDEGLPVALEVLEWFLKEKSPNLQCRLVPNDLHAKVIWWEGVGAYIGSANLTVKAWGGGIEAGLYVTHEEMIERGLDSELENFFDVVHEKSHELTREVYDHLKTYRDSSQRREAEKAALAASTLFEKGRKLPVGNGLDFFTQKKDTQKVKADRFAKEWNDTLQKMRDLGERLNLPDNRPNWVAEDVPAGVQADQFLHAFYYDQVRSGASYPYDVFHARNKGRVAQAVDEAIAWWKAAEFDHAHEEVTIYQWSPLIRTHLEAAALATMTESEFCLVMSRVHAVRDHATKQSNVEIGLPSVSQSKDDKVAAFTKHLFALRSAEGKTPVETIQYVLHGGAKSDLAGRLWEATRSPRWKIPHLGVSSLGEMVGWAMPDLFPPRNMRSSKALKALGFEVEVHL